MFTNEHSSWQCNILFDKVSDHNSYIQVCNATCKITIYRAKGWSKIRGETFYQWRNNSTCDVRIQDVRWHINHQAGNSTCDVTIWICIVTMQHSTSQFNHQFNMLVGTGYWNGRRYSRPEPDRPRRTKIQRDAFYSPKFLSFRLQCSWANSMIRVDTEKSCSDTFRASRVNSKDLGMGYSQTSKLLWDAFFTV